ncbi:MAG TPA: gliding motility protein GldM, partial [Chitinophagaceae bacterium]|nr:gliding motility protein GldM [Chitinophagaceae bacterium]
MALPKEPRQKMINLMYLVLTALLALNVSAEILNAFMTVNNSLSSASTTIEEKNKTVFSSFDSLLADSKTQERARIWKPYADQAKQLADATVAYLQSLQMDLKKASGYDPKTGEFQLDELEEPTRLLADPGVKGNELLKKLTDFKNSLLAISPELKKEFENSLPLDLKVPKSSGAVQKDWKNSYFNMVPTIAAITILSKFENDVR